ncbi:MAG: MFS transporter [Solirubrobacterales bacterium]|nr:MFS transporter [Solirubrobacterales bacterium]
MPRMPIEQKRGPVDRHERAGAWTLTAAVLGNFMVIFDAVVVNVALPSIRRDLGGGVTGLQWIVDGYTVMFAALLLSAGALSDRFGARRAYVAGLSVFVTASAACGLAPGLGVLVGARFVQGAAAAAMVPASMALIRHAFSESRRRARAVAMWAVGGAIAASSGPVLGGVLTLLSWRAIFFINVPVGALALLLLTRAERSPRRTAPFDWVGQATAILAIGGLTYGAIEGGANGFGTPTVDAAFVVAAVALLVFLSSQARGAHPMLPLDLFRSRNVSVATAVGFAFMVGYYGLPFVMCLYLQQHRGLSALMTGVAFLPMMLSGTSLTPFSAPIAERVGARPLIAGGLTLMAAGLLILALAPLSIPVWGLAGLMILVGVAGPLVMPPGIAVLLESIPPHQAGTASGMYNTSRQIGGALAVAVFGSLLAHRATFADGVHISLLLAAAVVLTAAAVSLLLRPVRSDAQAKGDLPAERAPGQRVSNGATAATTLCTTS